MNTKITHQHLFADRVSNVPMSFLREILKVASNPGITSFAGGLPNPDFFPVKELQQSAIQVFQKNGMEALQYSSTEGFLPLREFISERYRTKFNLKVPAEQILITNGSQQALDLLGKIFINPGDKVLVERPSYLGALQCLSVFQPEIKDISLNSDGLDTIELENALATNDIRLLYCIPNFQNPTGISYSLETRRKVTSALSNYPAVLIEDDPYGDISFTEEAVPPMYKFLPDQTVLLGSFSKTVSPGIRIGWMVANPEIIRKVTIMKQACDLHTSNLTQQILFEFLSNYDLEKHISKIKNAYQQQRDVMMNGLNSYFPFSVNYTRPKGGMFTWVTLPEPLSSRTLLGKAIEENIIFVPGDVFYASNPNKHTLRMNFSNVDVVKMDTAMQALGKLVCY
jgi:2-aminoadipate transaminase